jgi:hypothetical protein
MGLQHYTQDMSRIPLKYHTNVLFFTKYTHPTLICRGTDARTDGRTHGRMDGWTENIYSIFRDKLLLLGDHVHGTIVPNWKDAVGLGNFVCDTKSKKTEGKADRAVNDEPYINKRKPLSTMAAKGHLNNGPSPKKMDGNGDQVVDDKPFIDKRKPSSMTAVKGNLNNGEHTLISVTVKMIHSAVRDCKWFVLKDGQPLQMVKLVGAVRNFHVHVKHVQIDLEDGIGLVRVILWRKQKECTAQRHLIDECNGNCYICVIREIEYYYGVREIIASNI